MAAENPVSLATRELVAAVDALHATVCERLPAPSPVVEVRGYVSEPIPADGLALGLRFCVDVESGESLAQRLTRVPAEYLEDRTVRCVCGAEHQRARLVECPGGCGRWFVGDASGVWAARLEPEEPPS